MKTYPICLGFLVSIIRALAVPTMTSKRLALQRGTGDGVARKFQ